MSRFEDRGRSAAETSRRAALTRWADPAYRAANTGWTPEADAELTALWRVGLSLTEIGRRMGLSKNAIGGRAHRLHLRPRATPIKGKPITDEIVQAALRLRAEGNSRATIARTLGVSMAGLAHRIAKIDCPAAATGPTPRRTLPSLPSADPPLRRPAPITTVADRSCERRATPALRVVHVGAAHTCQFPMGGDDGRPGREPLFCGAPSTVGSYCAEHAARCFVATARQMENAA